MSLASLAIRRPITVSMTVVAVVIFGIVAAGRLPVNLLPEISYPTLTVECRLPGAAPVEMESLVTKPIEEAVGVVPGVVRLTSLSKPGTVQVKLEFGWGRDMDVAAMDVRQKLDLVTLPRDAEKPRVLRYDPNEEPVVRVGITGTRNMARLRHYAEHVLKKRLESVDGVAAIKIQGGHVEELQVDLDEGRLLQAGLTQADVVRALSESNVNAAGGSLYEDEARYLVRTSNELLSLEDVASVVVRSDGARQIRVGDLGRVVRGVADREVITRIGGHEAVELQVFKEGDANAVHVAARFHAALETARKALPAEVRTVVLFDQSRFINAAIAEVRGNAVQGTVLAVLVLLLFLRDVRSTLIIALTIPVSVVVTFFVMHQMGVSLNVMSLGGLALGVGMLVDGAIVVLEAIQRRHEGGEERRAAAEAGAREIGMAVTASVLTTVVVFVPLIFMEGVAAQLFRDQALTVTASLLVSLVLALSLIPMLAARGGRAGIGDGRRRSLPFRLLAASLRLARRIRGAVGATARLLSRPVDVAFRRTWGRFEAAYPAIVSFCLARPWTVVTLGALFTVLSIGPYRTLSVELIPPMQQGEILLSLSTPEGTPLERTADIAAGLEAILVKSPEVATVFTSVGSRAELQAAGASSAPNEAQIHVVLKERGDRGAERAVAGRVREALASMPGVRHELASPGSLSLRAPLEVEIFGDDLGAITHVAQETVSRLERLPELADVRTEAREGNPEVQVTFDRDRLAMLGLEPRQVGETLRSRLHGEVATRITEGDRDIDLRVRASQLRDASVEDLAALTVAQANGAAVALHAVAHIAEGKGPSEIRRIGQRRAAIVAADLDGIDLGAATRDVRRELQSIPLPAAVLPPQVSGQSQELERSTRQLALALLLAAFLVYFVMASQFESLLHPLLIMATIPMGVAGSVLGLWVTGEPLSVVALIGVVLLSGIVVNNAIVLIDAVNQLRASGLPATEALVAAGSLRLRPIFMTTLTTVLGLLPMAFGFGEGAELSRPLAVAVLGGMAVSTLLTLVVIPCGYLLLSGERVAAPAPAAAKLA